jgi:hypothetical protein
MLYAAGTVQDIPVEGERLCGLTFVDGLLWFSDASLEQILAVRIDNGQIERRIVCPGVRTGLSHFGRHLIQVVTAARVLREIDIDSGAILRELPNPRPDRELCGIETCRKGIWLGYRDVQRLDLRRYHDLKLVDTIAVDDDVAGVTVVDRFIAFASYPKALIHLVDPQAKLVVASIGVPGNPTGLTFDGRRIWYCDYNTSQIRAIELPGLSLQNPIANAIDIHASERIYRLH